MSEWQPEPHTLGGAHAMDALEGQDRTRFERHLERCEECTREVAGLREASARLAAAAAAQPPAALIWNAAWTGAPRCCRCRAAA